VSNQPASGAASRAVEDRATEAGLQRDVFILLHGGWRLANLMNMLLLEDAAMTVQTDATPRSLWREQADRWLDFSPAEPPSAVVDRPDDDLDPDPPPAAPALRPWPRVVPGL
jgi:hypothetical protein